ncbi:paramyosin-like [Zingiber officinale]|uniref:paramyosin-like n=1 Tax=Zingiber officinale TaxID=94328 RepID=UPI001C4BAF9D|nr:paramyosin-like [Zingiber officinale]
MLAVQKYVIHKLLLEGVLYIFGLSLIHTQLPSNLAEVMLHAHLASKAKLADVVVNAAAVEALESRSMQLVDYQEDPQDESKAALVLINAEVAKLRADLAKSTELLEAERGKSIEHASLLARLNKQVSTFDAKIESANARKLWAIKDMDLKNKEARTLTKKLKEAKDFLVTERKSWSAEETALRGQLSVKNDELATAKDELEASRAALKTYQDAEPSRFEAMKKNCIHSDAFNDKVADRALRLFDLVIEGTFDQLQASCYISAALSSKNWVEQIAISNRLAELEDELKKLKAAGDSRQSTAALEKAERLLEAERGKTSGLTSEVARLEALVKQRDKEVKTATARKLKAIDDMDLMKVENRGLEQRVKELDASLTAEREGRSADRTKAEGALQDLQATLDASQTALKDYQNGEPS